MVVQEGPRMSFVEEMDQFLVRRVALPAFSYVLNRKDGPVLAPESGKEWK